MNQRYALITGASGGIGSAIAERLAEEGWNLYLHYFQNEQAVRQLCERLAKFPIEVVPVQADLSQDEGYKKIVTIVDKIDAVILNSGNSYYGLVTDISDADAKQMINLHVTTPFLLTKAIVPKLIKQRLGNIIAITSIWGEIGASCEVLYSMVKGSQNTFVKALGKELALSGITVNAVSPGAVSTGMLSGFSAEELASIAEEIPMGRLAVPDEIAGTVSFLLSPDARYITGQIIGVNGGWRT